MTNKSHWHSDLMRRVKEPEYVGGRYNEAKKLIPQLIWWGYSSEEVFQMLRSKYSRSYTDSQLWNTIRWAQRTVTPRSPDRFKPQARRVSYPRVRKPAEPEIDLNRLIATVSVSGVSPVLMIFSKSRPYGQRIPDRIKYS